MVLGLHRKMVDDMTEQELQAFGALFREYCKQEISKGHCEPDCCDICPINDAYNKVFNGE